MRNRDHWQPSKFIVDGQSHGYVPNPAYVGVCSRYICGLYINLYAEIIRDHSCGVFLDLGCGDVPYYQIYRDRVTETVCVDWENSLHENPYVDQTADLNKQFPFQDNTFDTVLAADVLEHISNPFLFIKETARVLKAGGKSLIMVPFHYWIHEEPHDYFRYTEYALRKMCADNGLSIVRLEAYGTYPDILLDLFNKKMITTEAGVKRFLRVARWIQATNYYKKLRASTSLHFPLGYCLVATKSSG